MKSIHSLLILCIISIVFFLGCTSESKTLKVSPTKFQYDDQYIGDYQDKEFVLTNKYGKDITITTLTLSGSSDFSFSDGGSTPVNMLKGTTHTVTIRFEPNTAGVLNGLFSIQISETDKVKEVALIGTGVPIPRIALSENSHDYGIVKNGTTKDYDFEIENYGTANLNINNLNVIGPNAALFTITQGGPIPIVVLAGSKTVITVQFAPVADGNFSAEIQIGHDAINESSPMTITLDGEGKTATPEITLNIPITTPWDMGEVNINDSKKFDFEISNTGTSDLTISTIGFQTGTDFGFVEVQDTNGNPLNLPQTIGVSDHIVAFVEFSPIAKGILKDVMEIGHDGINHSDPLKVDVEGEGKGVAIFTNPGVFSWKVPAGVTSVNVLVVGAGGGGSGSHYGGGGSGWSVVQQVTVTPGSTISVTVGAGGAGGIVGTNSSPGGHGTDSVFGSYVTAPGGKGGGGGGAGYYTGGDGGSGGGGAGNMGYAGKGGTAGANGDPGATYAGGIGGHFDSLSGFNGNLTAGAGGAAGTSTNAGGGGGGGVLIGGNGPSAGDGGETWSGKGGKGYGSGGGSGGYNSGTRPGGGKGADGLVYIEY